MIFQFQRNSYCERSVFFSQQKPLSFDSINTTNIILNINYVTYS